MRILSILYLTAFSMFCVHARVQHEQLEKLVHRAAPAHMIEACWNAMHDNARIPDDVYEDVIATWNTILNDAYHELNDETYAWIKQRLPHSYRAPRPTSDQLQILESTSEDDVPSDEQPAYTNFALSGGLSDNRTESAGFNFATDRATSCQSNKSMSYNFSTYESDINTYGSHSFNFATATSTIFESDNNANFNLALAGTVNANPHSKSVSCAIGDETTRITIAGGKHKPATGYNVVVGSGSQATMTDTSREQRSINFVTSGAHANNPANGINIYPGEDEARVFGDLNLEHNNICNIKSLDGGDDAIVINSPLDINHNSIMNADVGVNVITSDDDIIITYDQDDTNTTDDTDEAFIIRSGSEGATVLRIDKNNITIQGRPLNVDGGIIEDITSLRGATNQNMYIRTNAESGETASVVLDPAGSGDVELRNIAHGSGAPLVIDNGIVKEENSTRRFKQDIQPCSKQLIERLLHLAPVSFVRSESQSDREFGLIAEDVDHHVPDLVIYENDGVTPHSIKYNQLAALVLYLCQYQEQKIRQQEDAILQLQERIDQIEQINSYI